MNAGLINKTLRFIYLIGKCMDVNTLLCLYFNFTLDAMMPLIEEKPMNRIYQILLQLVTSNGLLFSFLQVIYQTTGRSE